MMNRNPACGDVASCCSDIPHIVPDDPYGYTVDAYTGEVLGYYDPVSEDYWTPPNLVVSVVANVANCECALGTGDWTLEWNYELSPPRWCGEFDFEDCANCGSCGNLDTHGVMALGCVGLSFSLATNGCQGGEYASCDTDAPILGTFGPTNMSCSPFILAYNNVGILNCCNDAISNPPNERVKLMITRGDGQ